jgi:CheY-like chemotaxis protein
MTKKPYILALDDDPAVLRAVERDLKSRFSGDYRILAADAPDKAMTLVQQLTARGDRIALFLVDQRMPHISGTEFLMNALPLQPDARRVLLTAYADSSAAIDAINKVKLNHYLMKPWEPPEQNLYPILADLLEDWNATSRESFEGIYVVGTRWSPSTHEFPTGGSSRGQPPIRASKRRLAILPRFSPWSFFRMVRFCRSRHCRRWRPSLDLPPHRFATFTTSLLSARARRVSLAHSIAAPRDCARFWWSGKPRAAKRG